MIRALAVLAMAVAVAGCDPGARASPFKGIDITGSEIHASATPLTGADGRPHSLAEYRGKAVLVIFGYTHCPDVCPTSLADAAKALKALGNDASRVQVVFVGVDPKRDTPQLLRDYVTAFRPDFVGLTGSRDAIVAFTKDFKVYSNVEESDEPAKYKVEHSGQMIVLDPKGQPRLMFAPGMPSADIASDLKVLLDNA